KGFGHGVGMAQWGAKIMAERGKSPDEIVKYYFKDVEIVNLWD
ncbi:MAG: stage sporulation protein, partial [Thermosediminibacterales bacterium]|nr:stage sporulation protein [Thermosediminibacterales bacterium]